MSKRSLAGSQPVIDLGKYLGVMATEVGSPLENGVSLQSKTEEGATLFYIEDLGLVVKVLSSGKFTVQCRTATGDGDYNRNIMLHNVLKDDEFFVKLLNEVYVLNILLNGSHATQFSVELPAA